MENNKKMGKHIYFPPNHFAPKINARRLGVMPFLTAAFMADIIGVANCASPDSVFNTGIPPCDLAKKKMKGIVFADSGVVFTPADCASPAAFIAAVKLKTTAARGGRVYPIWDLLNFEDNTGDPATGSVGNLTTATIITSDAIPAFSFGYNGSEARHKRMSAMNGASLDVFFVDEQWAVYGTREGDNFAGFSVLQAYGDTSKFIVSDAVNQYRFRTTLGDISQYRDNSEYVVVNSGLAAAVGLVDVVMSKLSNATNVYKIKIIADGGTDLMALYGGIIAGLTFTAINLDSGVTFTVTSVAYDSTLQALTVTLDSTAYTAAAVGTRIQLKGPSAAALSTANVKPYEIIPVILVK